VRHAEGTRNVVVAVWRLTFIPVRPLSSPVRSTTSSVAE